MTVFRRHQGAMERNAASAAACRSMLDRLGNDYPHAALLRSQIDLLGRINAQFQAEIDNATLADDCREIVRTAQFRIDEIVRRNFRGAVARVSAAARSAAREAAE